MAELRHHALRPTDIDAPHRRLALGDFPLESGEVLRDLEISYVVHGELGGAEPVLVLCAIGSTHHRLDFLIGEGRALDPAKRPILCVDAIGNGLTTSPSTSLRQKGAAFPRFTIRDMVASQQALLAALGVSRLAAVIGASMGGMQALQWGVSHPAAMRAIVALVPMARTTPWSRAVNAAARAMLESGAGWRGWSLILRVLAARTPQALAASFPEPGAFERWLDAVAGEAERAGITPEDWIAQSHAYDAHDVGTTPGCGGDTATALSRVAAPTLVMAPALDLYNPAEEARWAASQIPRGRFVEIPSVEGHMAAGVASAADMRFLDREIARFLAEEVG